MRVELGQAQPRLGLGLNKIDLNNSNRGLTKVGMFQWGLHINSNNFFFDGITIFGLNLTHLGGWENGMVGGWVGGWINWE